jgi:hypothetical protein
MESGAAPCDGIDVGIYSAQIDSVSEHPNEDAGSIEAMKKDAAARGFDGIHGVRCAAPGTVGASTSTCTGTAYVCKESGK